MTLTLSSAIPQVVGIVADDLTGANDSLVQFARAGWTSRLALGELEIRGKGSTLATVTDSRSLPDDAAVTATAEAVTRLSSAGADRLYVKIDSTMRGSIPAQVDGALRAWREHHGEAFAVVCPAYPAMGRTVANGQLRVNGMPVESTSVGTDPVTPVTTSDLATLIPGGSCIQLGEGTATEHAQRLLGASGTGGPVIVDASTDEDLYQLAAALGELGPLAVPVGSAGLAAALAARWGADSGLQGPAASAHAPADRILVVVSSLHDMSRSQADRLINESATSDLLVLRPLLKDVQHRAAALAWAAAQQLTAAPGTTTLLLSPVDRADETLTLTGAEIADGLAAIAGVVLQKAVLRQPDSVALVLMGGDGARAVLRETAAQSVVVAGALQEGVPIGVVDGGTTHGLRVVTKAGGFGNPDSLTDIVYQLCNPSPSTTEALS